MTPKWMWLQKQNPNPSLRINSPGCSQVHEEVAVCHSVRSPLDIFVIVALLWHLTRWQVGLALWQEGLVNILLINMHAFQLSTKFCCIRFLPLLIKKKHYVSPIMSPLWFPLTWLFVANFLVSPSQLFHLFSFCFQWGHSTAIMSRLSSWLAWNTV